MKKDKLNAELRKLVKEKLSPTQEDRDFVAKIYKSFNDLFSSPANLSIALLG